jgi:hypothetical protein
MAAWDQVALATVDSEILKHGPFPTTLNPASEVMYAVQRRPSAPGAWLCAQSFRKRHADDALLVGG